MKKHIIGILVVVVSMGTVIFTACEGGTSEDAAVQTPAPRETARQVTAEGRIVPVRHSDLSFNAGGRLDEIVVEEGDRVEEGQVIARLNSEALDQQIAVSEANLALSRAQLEQLKSGSRSEAIRQAEANVEVAEAKLAQMKATPRAENVAIAEANLSAALAKLRELQAGPTEEQLKIAEAKIRLAKNQLFSTQTQADAQIPNPYVIYTKEMKEANTGIGWEQIYLAEAELDALKASPSEALVAQYQANVETARQQLELAKSPYTEEEIAQAEASVEAARQQLKVVEEPYTADDLKIAEVRVDQAKAAVEQVKRTKDDIVLKAPYAGTVVKIVAHKGEVVAPGVPVVEFGDLSSLEVQTTDLDENSATQISIGQEAIITIYAFDDKELSGTVTAIAPKASLTAAGDANYTVTIAFDEQDPGFRWGMTTKVELLVQE